MKVLCTLLLVILSGTVWSQIQLHPDSSYVKDGALVLQFKLVNASNQPIVIKMDTRKSLQQFNKQKLDEVLLSSSLQNFIVFYNKKNIVDEVVMSCDFQKPQLEDISLKPMAEYSIVVQTHCLSETVLAQLNDKHTLQYEMYIKYEESGLGRTLRTKRTKLRVRKHFF